MHTKIQFLYHGPLTLLQDFILPPVSWIQCPSWNILIALLNDATLRKMYMTIIKNKKKEIMIVEMKEAMKHRNNLGQFCLTSLH